MTSDEVRKMLDRAFEKSVERFLDGDTAVFETTMNLPAVPIEFIRFTITVDPEADQTSGASRSRSDGNRSS